MAASALAGTYWTGTLRLIEHQTPFGDFAKSSSRQQLNGTVTGNVSTRTYTLPLGPVEFTTVEQGDSSGIVESRNFVVNNQSEWSQLWTLSFCDKIYPCPSLPNVDFAKYTVLGIFLGSKPTGGYEIKITSIESTPPAIVVNATISFPGSTCIVTQNIEQPHVMVEIPKTTQTVILNSVLIPLHCLNA